MVCGRGATAVAVLPKSLLLLSLLCSVTQSVVLSPLSLVVSLDPEEMHSFHCSANGSGRADVKIDGQFFNSREIVDRGIFTTLDDVGGGVINTTIVIPATIENNNTAVLCLFYADTDPPSTELSRIGKFYVQGLLEAPGTDIAALNDSFLKFSWTPPFSLDISDSDLDILFYSFSENLTNTAVSVSSVGEFVFLALAVPVEFTVSAWNVVGEGEAAITTHQPCSIPEEQQMVSAAGVRSEVIYQENGRGSLSLYIPWPVGCFPLFSLELAEVEGGEGEVVSHDLLLPLVTGSGAEREVHLVVPLEGQDNTHYTAQLVSITDEGVLPAQDKLTYSTHDVQVVEIDFTPNSITTNCQFAVGSLALGCSVYIARQDNDDIPVVSLSAMRNSNEQGLPLSVEVTAENLESGVYTVTVYDIESNGETKIEDTPAHTETVDITEPTKPTSPPTTSSDTPDIVVTDPLSPESNAQTNNAVPIIAGAIVAGVLLIALVLLVLVSVTVWGTRRRREKKAEEADSREREFVLIATGATISSESVSAAHLNPANTLQVSSSSSPSHTLPGSATSLQRNSLSKDTLPPAYSELETSKYLHVRSMSDVVTVSNTNNSAGSGGVASQGDTVTTAQIPSQKKAVEATLSAPPNSPPPIITPSQTGSSSAAPRITSHTHLMRHERSSSLGGSQSSHPHTPSFPPSHPPKKTNNSKRHRAPPAPSFSTSALLPPHIITPSPLSLPTLSPEATPSGREVLSLGDERPAVGNNPLYDTTVALLLKAEEKKRRSIHYAEVVPRTQSVVATPTEPGPALPRDREAVLYSEVNVEKLVPRLPSKRTHTMPASHLMDIHSAL